MLDRRLLRSDVVLALREMARFLVAGQPGSGRLMDVADHLEAEWKCEPPAPSTYRDIAASAVRKVAELEATVAALTSDISILTKCWNMDATKIAELRTTVAALKANLEMERLAAADYRFGLRDAKSLLKETLGHLDAYDIAASQYGNLRDRLRKYFGMVGESPLEQFKKENTLAADLGRLVAEKDQAYAERNKCVALIAFLVKAYVFGRGGIAAQSEFDAWLGHHDDSDDVKWKGWDPEWRNVVFVRIPTGQLSWHIHDSELHMFSFLRRVSPLYGGRKADFIWDGHTTEQKYDRILRFIGAK